jgi:hypothetical protein
LFLTSNIRLVIGIGRFCCKSVFELVETVYTSIGLWGLYLIKYEIQLETIKKTSTGRDNILTGSFSKLNDGQKKRNDSCKIDFKHDETQEQQLPNVSQDSIQQKTDPDEKKYHDSGIKLPVSTVLKSTSWADCVSSESETEVDDALDPVKGDSAVVAILYTNKGSNNTNSQFSGSETSTEEASRKNHFGSSQLECSNGQTTEQIKQTDDEKSLKEEPLAENGHNLSECSESSDSGSGDGGAINKNKPRDRDGFTLVTKRKRNYRNHEFKNPTKSVYKQQPNGSSAPQSSKEYNGANRVLGLHGDSAAVEEDKADGSSTRGNLFSIFRKIRDSTGSLSFWQG